MADKKISALDDGTAIAATDKIPIERSGANYYLTGAYIYTLPDAQNIAVGTTTGTKIGTAASQKLGFWNATPVVQQAHIADAATNLATDYTDDAGAKDLDTDAKRVAAMNTTNTRVNAIATSFNGLLAKLETMGLLAAS